MDGAPVDEEDDPGITVHAGTLRSSPGLKLDIDVIAVPSLDWVLGASNKSLILMFAIAVTMRIVG